MLNDSINPNHNNTINFVNNHDENEGSIQPGNSTSIDVSAMRSNTQATHGAGDVRNIKQLQEDVRDEAPAQPASAPRWFSLEFFFYWILTFYGFFLILKWIHDVSEPYNTGEKTVPGVVPGWFFGRKQDLSDPQWNTVRSFWWVLLGGLSLFVYISNLVRQHLSPNYRIWFYNVTAFGIMVFLHGTSAFFVYFSALVNYAIGKSLSKSRYCVIVTWIFNLVVLWTSYTYDGYRFGSFLGAFGQQLDQHRGVLEWNVYWKISMLRFISFNCDNHWMTLKRPVPTLKNRTAYFIAQETHHAPSVYDVKHYLAYVLYFPLYVAGPIVSFNAFVAQVYSPQTTHTTRRLLMGLLKIAFVTLCFEISLHFSYLYAFNESGLWKSFRTYQTAITGYFVLNFMYVKFLIIWRVFRLAAQFDGIDTPENMNRCVNNNFTFAGFWRSWHGSFNTWTVRYMYIPMGGKSTQHFTIWIIFIFIGLWHDLWLSWVAWALLNCVFMTGELLVISFFSKLHWLHRKFYWRWIVGLAGSLNIFLLMVANLAILHGFKDSAVFLRDAFLISGGPTTFLFAYCWFFCGVMFMLEIRESEKRHSDVKRF